MQPPAQREGERAQTAQHRRRREQYCLVHYVNIYAAAVDHAVLGCLWPLLAASAAASAASAQPSELIKQSSQIRRRRRREGEEEEQNNLIKRCFLLSFLSSSFTASSTVGLRPSSRRVNNQIPIILPITTLLGHI